MSSGGAIAPRRAALSVAARFAVSVLVAGAIVAYAIRHLSDRLDVRTDIVGYPTFAAFDPDRYITGYRLLVIGLPLLALAIYQALTLVGRRLSLVPGARRWESRRLTVAAEPDDRSLPTTAERLARAALVGAVGALELTIMRGSGGAAFWATVAAGAVAWPAAAGLVALLVRLRSSPRTPWTEALSAVNAFSSPLLILGLCGVSAGTRVDVLSDGREHHYQWFPLWVGIPLTAAAAWLLWRRRAREPRAHALEGVAVLAVALPVLLVVLLVRIPGEAGPLDFFHEGEALVPAQRLWDGAFPWKDIISAHGFLQDFLGDLVGLRLYDASRWGALAGHSLLLTPLYYVALYALLARLLRTNWLFLAATLILIVDTALVPETFEFLLWPVVLLVLLAVVQRPSPWRCAALAFLLVVQAVLSPEAAGCIAACAVVLVGLEVLQWDRARTARANLPRVTATLAFGLAFTGAFAVFLLANHALGDFVYFYTHYVSGHTLTGGIPTTLRSEAHIYVVMVVATLCSLVAGAWYLIATLRARRPLSAVEWTVMAAGIMTLVYFEKYLARADGGHAAQVFSVAVPYVLYVGFRVCAAIDSAVARWGGSALTTVTRRLSPAGAGAVVVVAALAPTSLTARLSSLPAQYVGLAGKEPVVARLGYASPNAVDMTLYSDLASVLRAYLGPTDTVLDFSNQPALVEYLLDERPVNRFFHVQLAISEATQRDFVSSLVRTPPKLVLFDAPVGLPIWDGITNQVRHYDISRFILDHYRPLMAVDGEVIYVDRTASVLDPTAMGLALGHPPVTSDVPFAVRSCNWGHTLDYLDTTPTDDNGTAGTSVAATPAPGASVSLRGWAGDERTGRPARAVLVVVNGAVIDRIEPQLDRPDVAQVTGHPGFETSGFSDVLPVPGWTPGSIVSVYALGADGTASRIDTPGGATPPTLDLGEGQTARVAQGALSGSVDALGVVPSPITLTPPPGRSWSDFHWMEIRARAGSFRDGSLVLTDGVAAPGHSIVVEVGSRSPAVIIVPVGSCAQWHGYGAGGGLSLQADHPDDIAAVRLLP